MKHRWYDKDPTVSLAISLLRNSNENVKKLCASKIYKITEEHNVKVTMSVLDVFKFEKKRWYDEDKELSEAMEYLKNSSDELRKEIALELINIIQYN